jgi:protoporphyrinogen oxidase
MKVAVIGAGFGGLAAGYRLAKNGASVSIFESEDRPGGLAVGFKEPKWNWTIEEHYHHWFTNDYSVLALCREIGQNVVTTRPRTSTFIDGKGYQLDSPLSLLFFTKLKIIDRLRTGMIIAYLKLTSNWKSLESVTSEEYIKKYMGESSWKVLWQPLFDKKFSNFASKIPASWFWARIKKRTSFLSYPEGGFLAFAAHLNESIRQLGGKIYYKTAVLAIKKKGKKLIVKTSKYEHEFDKVICTLPLHVFAKITKDLSDDYLEALLKLKSIGSLNLMISLNKQFLEDGTYWLNINPKHFPFLAVVEHTNFMDRKFYNDEHLIYIANYLPHNHPYFRKDRLDLFREFFPYLKTINPKLDKSWIKNIYLFKASFAQPIIPLNYSKLVPGFETPINGLYLATMQQVYPWDRGTNYAIANGENVADIVLKS